MDRARNRISPLNDSSCIDLHLHSTASDGECHPVTVVQKAARIGLTAIALTDHDSVAGVPDASAEGARLGVRVIGGCEFSVAAPWGEMHLLGYFLAPSSPGLETFLSTARVKRQSRAQEMVNLLQGMGVDVTLEDVLAESGGGAVGRPHVGRALIRAGAVRGLNEAFDRYIGRGKGAYVAKELPTLSDVCALVHRAGGLTSAAHLKDRGTRNVLKRFQDAGLDAIETRHPSHNPEVRAGLTDRALELGLLRTGGSDWHGDGLAGESHGTMGSQSVPAEWLGFLEGRLDRAS
ncbi:MAG: PHP domain-containing protein [Gemmatimonadota bacterium]